jgi:hypothetical protein
MVASSPPPPARRVARTTGALLFRRGEMLSPSSPPPGESETVVVVAPRGEKYHVVAVVEGHELETPKAEHRLGLKRLLKTPHLELNGKVFVNTQQAPTWRTNCRRFGPGGVPGPTSEIVACPCPDGLARDGTQEVGKVLYYPAPGVPLVVGVTSASREGERKTESRSPFVRSFPARTPLMMALDLPFIDARRGSSRTTGGVAMR